MPIRKEAIAGPAAWDRSVAKAEAMYEKLIKQGKVTPANRRQIKEKIARKTGVYVTTDAN